MSYIGSDAEQDNKNASDFRRQRSSSNLMQKPMDSPKLSQQVWNDKQQNDDTDSEVSDSGNFLAKGAFLLTPSHELTMDRAAMICEKMNFKGCFSLTKTATGILFKFSHPEDYQAVFKKGFHKVTGARFYKKVSALLNKKTRFELKLVSGQRLPSLAAHRKHSPCLSMMYRKICQKKTSDMHFTSLIPSLKLLDSLSFIRSSQLFKLKVQQGLVCN